MNDARLKIAVFVDFDNIEIGVKTTLGSQFDIGAILEAVKERGEVVTKVAYGDWKRTGGDYSRSLSQHAIRMVQRNLTPGGDKNGADINLALDALEMAFTHDHINAFVIVGGDSDFITLVEKLKQYDKKVFVVGGRQFTSQVMQKNCHEFIAYENLVGRRQGTPTERSRPSSQADLGRALPLVKRALKILTDREVTPQLGLLKSTLLQLDSTFSERDYGASSFRDFIEKVARTGAVTLRHTGRSILVDLAENAGTTEVPPADATPVSVEEDAGTAAVPEPVEQAPARAPDVAAAVDLARRALSQPRQPLRWPLYLRQVQKALRAEDETFDERKLGFSGMVEFLRACQREALVRLERDRQGVMRVFPGPALPPVTAEGPVPAEPAVTPVVIEAVEALVAADSGETEGVPAAEDEDVQPIFDAAPEEDLSDEALDAAIDGNRVGGRRGAGTRARRGRAAGPKAPATRRRAPARAPRPRKKKDT